ncbi:general secretion pathway protein GspH [Methylocucumis oryzae]|uniref:General secretion pathway protein GspH n=2 Tax=Methylocucumis oryzae TaxID=1632867 RepID=A0A0F3IIS8_9GAMM|nr:general secretion pathway protein GspH [Methylocucumis oryzae]
MIISMQTNSKQQGFSLLEILIAFAILAISLTILLKIFSAGTNTAIVAEEYTTAVQIAESLMTQVGVATRIQPGETSGDENERYHWRILITPYLPDPNLVDIKQLKLLMYQVVVTVSWSDGGDGERQLELSTLKLGTEESA